MVLNKKRRIKKWVTDKNNWKRLFVPLLILGILFTAARMIELDDYLQIVQKWVWQFGPWGAVVFVGIYVAATLFLFPGMPFTIMAAFLFGSLWGFVVMTAATTLAAVIGFMVARYLARDALERWLRAFESFEKLTDLVEQNSWLAIPFVRIMPIFPFSLNNYALGLTHLPFWR